MQTPAVGEKTPKVRISFGRELSRAERVDCWHSIIGEAFDSELERADEFFGSAEVSVVGAVAVLNTSIFGSHAVLRTPRHIAVDGIDDLIVTFLRKAHRAGSGRVMAAGCFFVIDCSRDLHVGQMGDSEGITVGFPRQWLLPHLVAADFGGGMQVGPSPASHIACKSAEAIVDSLSSLDSVTATPMLKALGQMVATAMNAELMRAPERVSRRKSSRVGQDVQLLNWIDANCTNPNLDVNHVCHEFGLSRASLYRALRVPNGISSYIRNRRLDYAFRMLVEPGRTVNISEVALKSGFTDPRSFRRAFVRRFGVAPGEASTPLAGKLPGSHGLRLVKAFSGSN